MNRLSLTMLGALALLPLSAAAVEDRWYMEVGFSSTDVDRGDLAFALDGGFGSDDSLGRAYGFQLTAGYQWTRYVAVEGRFADLGEADATSRTTFGVLEVDRFEADIRQKISISSTTTAFGAVLSTDRNRPLSVGGKAGLQFWDIRGHIRGTAQVVGFAAPGSSELVESNERFSESASESGTYAYYGVVARYQLGDWMLSLDHTVYAIDDTDPAATSLSLGLVF